MSEYKGIKGFQVQTRTEDPVPFAQALADNPYAGVWSSGGSLNTHRVAFAGSLGSQTAQIAASGSQPPGTFKSECEQYNGTSWTEIADVNDARNNEGGSGSGTTTAGLIYGGNTPPRTANTESWNGSAWTEVNDLNTARSNIMGVGTSTASLAFFGQDAPGGSGYTGKTESWDGTSWTETADGNTARGGGAGMGTSYSACFNVGGYTGPQAIVESWNGSSWTEIADLNEGRGNAMARGGTTTAGLIAGGNSPGTARHTSTESWDGSSWTEVNDLAVGRYALGGQSPSNTVAIAYGGNDPGDSPTAVTEEWAFSGVQPGDVANYVNAIVGAFYYNSTTGQFKTVNDGGAPIGTWASVSSINTARGRLGGFGTATAAIGAGGVLPPNGVSDAVESWNGSAWTEVAEINTARNTGHFQFGTSTNGIIAGGSTTGPGTPTLTVVESWNGSAWTETGDLNKTKNGGAASGTYTAGVIFGGFHMPTPPAYTILAETETWNGSAWTEVNDLNSSRYTNAAAIGGPSTATITFGRANQSPDSIVESWDGTNWTEVGDLNEGRESPGGAGTQTAAMAFGGSPNATLNEIWNGSSWTEANDLGTGRASAGNAGATNTSALAFGGANPGYTNVAEQFTAADFQIKSVTTS